MAFSRFRRKVVLNTIIICLEAVSIYYIVAHTPFYFLPVLLLMLIAWQVYNLITLVETSSRSLKRFVDAVRYSDFSQTFPSTKLGPAFDSLNQSFIEVMNNFRRERSEKEEQYQYLQTVLKQIGSGLISFQENGDVEFINRAAGELLSVEGLKNIRQLASVSPVLPAELAALHAGERRLIKINSDGTERHLSVSAAEFILRGRKYTLASLQDIKGELERERMAGELEIARTVQMRLLPQKSPQIPGYDISALCIPAMEMGGDYFDYVSSPGRLGLVIGDVSGKGIPAAIYMTLTKGIFQSYAEEDSSTLNVLARVNRQVHKTIQHKSFVTMCYALLDEATGRVTYTRAGHMPLIHYDSRTKSIHCLKPRGIGIGLESEELFRRFTAEESVVLCDNDFLFLYTDGLTEAVNQERQMYGEERLISLLESYKDAPAEEIINAVFNDVLCYSTGCAQQDDITMIAIRKTNRNDNQ